MSEQALSERRAVEQLNRECHCVTLDRALLDSALNAASGDDSFAALIAERRHLFSHASVFLSKHDETAMLRVVRAIEAATLLPAYRAATLAWAPEIAETAYGPRGMFMGYDFHLAESGPRLIEVNTNAGGAFLNAFLADAQIACCDEVKRTLEGKAPAAFELAVIAMVEAEWRLQGRREPLRTIAIVDDAPQAQYLYPEFVIAQRMLERHGYEVIVADAAQLRHEAGQVYAGAHAIDLIYNRVVDFAFAEERHAALSAAYSDGAVVVSPNPNNHALFADKRNLTLLSDAATMRRCGLDETHVRALASLPRAVQVSADNAAALWDERKRYFFKPASGHGGKAVYRGDKLTKTAWETIVAGGGVAQELAPPSERSIVVDGAVVQRKLDVRLYTYDGAPLLAAARLYQGQTTNFRTPGGGFAPVFFL